MLLHADGFDHYGTTGDAATSGLMIADGYAFVSNLFVFGAQTINGKVYSPSPGLGWLYFNRIDRCFFKRAFNSVVPQWGQFRTIFTAVPDYPSFGYKFEDAAQNQFAWVGFNTDLSITIGLGNSTNYMTTGVVGTLKAPAFKVQTLQNWEIVFTPNTGAGTLPSPYNGSIALYLEGVLQLQVNGLNIAAPAYHAFGSYPIIGGNANCFFRDYIVGDASGAYNNLPMGPRRVGTRVANAVGGSNDWIVNGAANAALATNSIPPSATAFIEGDAVGNITELLLPASSALLANVAGVIVKSYMQKTSTAATTVKLGIRSNATVVNSPDIAPGQGFAYWNTSFFETDPNTGNPGFTKAAYDALAIRITRSA